MSAPLVAPGDYSELFNYGLFTVASVNSSITVNADPGENLAGCQYSAANDTHVGAYYDVETPLLPDTTDRAAAETQLQLLITDIQSGVSTAETFTGGTQTFLPNTVYRAIGNIGSSAATFTFDAGGDASAQFYIVGANYIELTNPTFIFANGALASNIFWQTESSYFTFTRSDAGTNYFPGTVISDSYIALTFNGPHVIEGHLFAQEYITIVGDGEFYCNPGPVVCYAKGSQILTSEGYKAIEDLKMGDTVFTKGRLVNNKLSVVQSQMQPILWTSKFQIDRMNAASHPICIKKDALGSNQPFEDLYVSPGHRMVIGRKMVLARDLVNGTTIVQDTSRASIEYYHLETANHSAIVVNGVLSETFEESGKNRSVFEPSPRLVMPQKKAYRQLGRHI